MLLYKYLIPDRIDVLQKKMIRLTQINQLNDPFEYGISISANPQAFGEYMSENNTIISEFIKLYPQMATVPKEGWIKFFSTWNFDESFKRMFDWEKYMNIIVEDMSKTTGVLSLSEIHDNNLMWAHYTNEHTGFVIEFETTGSMFPDTNRFRKISYQDKMLNVHCETVEHLNKINLHVANEKAPIAALYIKSTDWEYEKEWRLAQNFTSCDCEFQIGEKKIHLKKFNPRSVNKVFLGCNVDEDLKRNIIKLLKEDSEYSHVELYQASKDVYAYRLKFSQIKP